MIEMILITFKKYTHTEYIICSALTPEAIASTTVTTPTVRPPKLSAYIIYFVSFESKKMIKLSCRARTIMRIKYDYVQCVSTGFTRVWRFEEILTKLSKIGERIIIAVSGDRQRCPCHWHQIVLSSRKYYIFTAITVIIIKKKTFYHRRLVGWWKGKPPCNENETRRTCWAN